MAVTPQKTSLLCHRWVGITQIENNSVSALCAHHPNLWAKAARWLSFCCFWAISLGGTLNLCCKMWVRWTNMQQKTPLFKSRFHRTNPNHFFVLTFCSFHHAGILLLSKKAFLPNPGLVKTGLTTHYKQKIIIYYFERCCCVCHPLRKAASGKKSFLLHNTELADH